MASQPRGPRAFVKDDRGNIAILFGIAIFVILAAAGAAIDFLRIDKARTALNEAGDAALIAAARHKGANPDADNYRLTEIARRLFDAQMRNEPDVSIGAFAISFNTDASVFRLDVDADLDLLIMGLFGAEAYTLDTVAEAKLGKPPYIELAMALDVTGSMNSNGKLATLKSASVSLIDTLFGQPGADVRIGIAPFAQYVNISDTHVGAIWLEPPAGAWGGCAGSRPFPFNVEDREFAVVKVPGLNPSACPPAVTPLTDDAEALKDRIDALTASGWTYIPAGLMWGWSLLSSQEPFTEGVTYAELPAKNGIKALMLMTDGANTRAPDYPTHNLADAALANDLTRDVCENIKPTDIVIYTIAFEVTDTAIKDILRNCATTPAYYFDAENSADLIDAFGSIAASLRNISLSK
ncbi:MAG: vWA domain-containing protein [Parvularculaceae bacterium]